MIQTEKYLLTCYRYIELNPVRANMVASPEEYKWTSYRTNTWGDTSSWLLPHKEYKRLGDDVEGLFLLQKTIRNQMNDDDFLWVRKAVHYCQPTGDELFAQMISKKYGIVLGQMARGRPKRSRGISGG